MSQFRNASAFASWLGLCPERQISGGKVLFTKSRRVRSRVALALRWRPIHYTMPKTIVGNSFDASAETGQTTGDHCYSSQIGAHRIPSAEHQGGIQRERIHPVRRRGSETC